NRPCFRFRIFYRGPLMTESSPLPRIQDYLDDEVFRRMKAFADQKETPFVVIDTATIEEHYQALEDNFPYASIYYAVKANPATEILKLLRDRGANFDVASIYELDKLIGLDVTGDRISYGNTIKKSRD